MLFMKAKKDPTYTGVKSTVSAATCMQAAVFTARLMYGAARLMRLMIPTRGSGSGRSLL